MSQISQEALKQSYEFERLMTDFMATLEASTELLDVIAPKVAALDAEPFAVSEALEEFDALPEARRAEAFEYVGKIGELLLTAADWAEGRETGDIGEERKKTLAIEFGPGEGALLAQRRFQAFLRRALRRRDPRLSILLRALVMTSVSAFETLIGGLMSEFYRRHPAALDGGGKEFSLDDLSQFESLDDARDVIIQNRVNRMLYGSFEGWRDAFAKRLKIDFAELALEWGLTREVFARRNALVHASGRVNLQYLRRVGPEMDRPIGERLEVDEEYVRETLDRLAVLGLLVNVHTWVKLVPEAAEAAVSRLWLNALDFLARGRWTALERLCLSGRDVAPSERQRLMLQCMGWVAQKRLGRENVLREVEAFDASALDRDFQLSRLCLLGHDDEALGVLRQMVNSGEMPRHAGEEWPIFDEFRDDPRFSEILDRA